LFIYLFAITTDVFNNMYPIAFFEDFLSFCHGITVVHGEVTTIKIIDIEYGKAK